jgi:hypothetical protein
MAEREGGYGREMKTVALSIMVMGVSLAIVIVLWIWFGHLGPTFSTDRMLEQQTELREQYGLPYQPPVPESLQQVPPSLRNMTQTASSNNTSEG